MKRVVNTSAPKIPSRPSKKPEAPPQRDESRNRRSRASPHPASRRDPSPAGSVHSHHSQARQRGPVRGQHSQIYDQMQKRSAQVERSQQQNQWEAENRHNQMLDRMDQRAQATSSRHGSGRHSQRGGPTYNQHSYHPSNHPSRGSHHGYSPAPQPAQGGYPQQQGGWNQGAPNPYLQQY